MPEFSAIRRTGDWTTLRPLGPGFTLAAWVSIPTPRSIQSRTSVPSPNMGRLSQFIPEKTQQRQLIAIKKFGMLWSSTSYDLRGKILNRFHIYWATI
jgi:hypothetical protein